MPVIEMSQGFAAGISQRMLRLAEVANQLSPSQTGLLASVASSNAGQSVAAITIFRGAPPVGFLTNFAARSSDALVTFSAAFSVNGNNFLTSNSSINPANVSTEYVAATGSGTATWFLWGVYVTGPNAIINTTATPHHQIIGTVGMPGTGNDLEMPNVNIVAGEAYRIINLRLQFQTSWVY